MSFIAFKNFQICLKSRHFLFQTKKNQLLLLSKINYLSQASKDLSTEVIADVLSLKKNKIFKPEIFNSLEKNGYINLTEVQQRSLYPIVKESKGVAIRAKTGTGKTLTFVLPTLNCVISEIYMRPFENVEHVSTLVIVPTRDLALQIQEEYKKILNTFPIKYQKKIIITTAIGGKPTYINYKRPPSVVIATPGRLLSLLGDSKFLQIFNQLQYIVYDEADRLFEEGFYESIIDIKQKLLNNIQKENTKPNIKIVLFTATFDKKLHKFAAEHICANYRIIDCVKEEDSQAQENVEQILVKTQDITDTYSTVISYLNKKRKEPKFKCIIFLPTIASTNWFYDALVSSENLYASDEISNLSKIYKLNGEISQSLRSKCVKNFRDLINGILVCTDVGARGLHFSDVTHVVQLNPNFSKNDYIHKIGRTARAGAKGKSLIFLNKNDIHYREILTKDLAIKFFKEITSVDLEPVEDLFEKLSVDIEQSKKFIQSLLSFQPQINSFLNLDPKKSLIDIAEFYKKILKTPDAKISVSKKFATFNLNLPRSIMDQYFTITNYRYDSNDSSKEGIHRKSNYGKKKFYK